MLCCRELSISSLNVRCCRMNIKTSLCPAQLIHHILSIIEPRSLTLSQGPKTLFQTCLPTSTFEPQEQKENAYLSFHPSLPCHHRQCFCSKSEPYGQRALMAADGPPSAIRETAATRPKTLAQAAAQSAHFRAPGRYV